MKFRFPLVAVITAFAAASYTIAQDQPAPAPPTWQDMLAAGIVPYRQLTVDDIPVADKADAKHAFYIRTAVEPRYHYFLKPHTNGFVYAYIDQWLVFSGLNRKESWRKSKFKTMKAELPYAQALLDINEIHARQLAALKTGELPQGRGATVDEARADMEAKLKQFVEAKYAQGSAEMRALAEATKNGVDKQRVKQLAAEIRKRLDATPATTVQANDAALSVNPMPSGSASPAASPSSTPAPYGYEQ